MGVNSQIRFQKCTDYLARNYWNLLPDSIVDAVLENFEWKHEEIQRELENLVVEAHDALYDLRIFNQQDKATLILTNTSIFQTISRSKVLQIPNEGLIYLAKQLFGKTQRKYSQILTERGS